ncbi:MAG: hypothetical protein H6713_40925 [Myxococcales bacterium]|nr:hypothetical protein [Myxococcales bacterium]MCB9756325.1 hypothetical protein [Myxococcales bacterium]
MYRRAIQAALTLAAAAATSALACGGGQSEFGSCAGDICFREPVGHSVCLDECRDVEDCPMGTICEFENTEATTGSCRVPLGVSSYRDALLRGFNVAEFPTARLSTTSEGEISQDVYVLEWSAPDDAVAVTCALFICPPAFASSQDEDGRSRTYIRNYDRCVVARTTSSQPDGVFDLRDPSLTYAPTREDLDTLAQSCGGTAGAGAPVTTLLTGCWAYNDHEIVAATQLLSPAVTGVLDQDERLAIEGEIPCDRAENNLKTCLWSTALAEAPYTTLGSCVLAPAVEIDETDEIDDRCLLRCLDREDCVNQARVAFPDLAADEDLSGLECQFSGTTLGYCTGIHPKGLN